MRMLYFFFILFYTPFCAQIFIYSKNILRSISFKLKCKFINLHFPLPYGYFIYLHEIEQNIYLPTMVVFFYILYLVSHQKKNK